MFVYRSNWMLYKKIKCCETHIQLKNILITTSQNGLTGEFDSLPGINMVLRI